MRYRYMDSPIGSLLLAGDASGLKIIGFPEGKGKVTPPSEWIEDKDGFVDVVQQLMEYFDGERTEFDLRLSPSGTSFQLDVLDALLTMPLGETRSYQEIARQIGRPSAVREHEHVRRLRRSIGQQVELTHGSASARSVRRAIRF